MTPAPERRPRPGTGIRRTGYICLALWLGGCGFFDLRDPVEPDVIVVIPNEPWTSADNVLYNLKQAIRYKQNGMAQYQESLSEDFQLVLDEIDSQELGTGLISLSKTSDVSAHRRLVDDKPDSFYFEFGEAENLTETDTTVFYEDIPYELLYIGEAGDTVGAARGVAELLVKEIQAARWALAVWTDQRADTSRTLGFLHGERAAGP